MSDDKVYYSLKVGRVDGSNKILDITDDFPIPEAPILESSEDEERVKSYAPRLSLNFTEYGEGKASTHIKHWVEEGTLLALAEQILTSSHPFPTDDKPVTLLREYKGSEERDKGCISRQLTISFSTGMKIGPAYGIKLIRQPGEKGDTGQVMPVKGSQVLAEGSIYIKEQDARVLMAKVKAHAYAKKAASYSLLNR